MKGQALDRFVSLLFPKGCVLCGGVVAYDDLICEHCVPDRLKGELCDSCGKPKESCVCRPEHKWAFKCAVSALHYREKTRGAIIRLKKTPDRRITRFFAGEMARALEDYLPFTVFDIITEVPIHPQRLMERGFNQAELLASELAGLLRIPHRVRLLSCVGEALPQHSLSREDRFKAAAERYVLSIRQVAGKTVLLCDDVMTTGATLDACARELKEGGAAEVYVLTAAGTDRISL